MIQRVQSLFYLLATLSAGALFFLPMVTSDKAAGLFMEDKVFNVFDHIGLTIVAVLATLLPFVAIFLYKNRSTQIKVGASSLVFPLLLFIAAILILTGMGNEAELSANFFPNIGIFLLVAALIFSILGNRFVKKDDELVKSSDRLR